MFSIDISLVALSMSNDQYSAKIYSSFEDGEKGRIIVDRRGIQLFSNTGGKYSRETFMDIDYSVDYEVVPTTVEGKSQSIPLEKEVRIELNPQTILFHPCAPYIGQIVEDVYPPSTHGFYGRMKQGKEEAVYIIQNIIDSHMKWLTIVHPENGVVYESHPIQPYEAESLGLFDNHSIKTKLYRDISQGRSKSLKKIMETHSKPSPSWKDIAKIVTDISIPNLTLKDNAHDTLSQLVPDSFPEAIREQLIAFLSFVIQDEIPDEDPVEFHYNLLSAPMLGSLIFEHIRYKVDDMEWPPYVKLMTLAAQGQLGPPKRAISDDWKDLPWMLFWQKCTELSPNWLHYAIQLASELNSTGKILAGLPITKSAAKRSKGAWKKRVASSYYDLSMIGHINTKVLGLSDLVYLGAAYRWPHRHMKFITRLGSISDTGQHLQVMTMPISAANQIGRLLPGAIRIGLSARISNLDMFDNSSKSWVVPAYPILDALGKSISERKLKQLMGKQRVEKVQSVTLQEAKVLDRLATGISLEDVEIQDIRNYLQIKPRILKSNIRNLVQRNLVNVAYEIFDGRLISLATIIQGKEDLLRSVLIAFLNNTPTTLAMLNDSKDQAILISRIPETTAYELASSLPEQGFNLGLNIRCMRPTIFKTYTHNLYQRLLNEDGTWDDDIGAFLSQARSKRKELSKSNA
jgi:DNA-binding MarR family transcriptional regulator